MICLVILDYIDFILLSCFIVVIVLFDDGD